MTTKDSSGNQNAWPARVDRFVRWAASWFTFPASKATKVVMSQLIELGYASGRDLRDNLIDAGVRCSLARFYWLMSKLEDGGHVTHKDNFVWIGGHRVKQRTYFLPISEPASAPTEGKA